MTKRDSQVARGCSPWLLPLPAIRGCSPWLLRGNSWLFRGYSVAPPSLLRDYSVATLRGYPPGLPSVATLRGYPPSLPSVATLRRYPPWLPFVATPRGYPPRLPRAYPVATPWLASVLLSVATLRGDSSWLPSWAIQRLPTDSLLNRLTAHCSQLLTSSE